jgi:hypothetical protein
MQEGTHVLPEMQSGVQGRREEVRRMRGGSGRGPARETEAEFISVVRSFNPQDIAIIESILADSGIEYYIQGKEGMVVYPLVDPASVMVVKEQAEEARDLLKDLDLSYYFFKPDHEEEDKSDDESSK